MFTSLKHILFFNLIVLSVISVSSQNTERDYIPAQLISYGFDIPVRMAIDFKDNSYAININNKWYAGNKVIIKKNKVAQFI
ncbi:MAG TPA: hypothetical protein VIS27_10300 [Yeosuana sp.]